MGEQGLSQRVVELQPERSKVEVLHLYQLELFVGQIVPLQLGSTRAQEIAVAIHTYVVTRFEIADEMDATPQAATSDIEKAMLGLESVRLEKIELELSYLIPHSPNRVSMPVGIEGLFSHAQVL